MSSTFLAFGWIGLCLGKIISLIHIKSANIFLISASKATQFAPGASCRTQTVISNLCRCPTGPTAWHGLFAGEGVWKQPIGLWCQMRTLAGLGRDPVSLFASSWNTARSRAAFSLRHGCTALGVHDIVILAFGPMLKKVLQRSIQSTTTPKPVRFSVAGTWGR